ncbi:MAG: hypothetical protein IKQ41_07150 [Clostridia bacterium]|nr:hypothetical protein [Clostridia bacterium]
MERQYDAAAKRGLIDMMLRRRDPAGDAPFDPDGEDWEELSGKSPSLEDKE